jgi:putative flavoprotein involved in K+ transport
VRTQTVVIGAGQAGLALSYCLRAAASPHVLLERGRVGERWRSERWDSLVLLTPNRFNGLPGAPAHPEPAGFLDRRGVIAYLDAYAAGAPVREHTTVTRVTRARGGFAVETDRGTWHAANVVIATGDCDVPYVPAIADGVPADLHQLHASSYRRPEELPPGGVLVVGAGPSGQQLAAELRGAGRRVVVATGRHARMPRRYRGRDVFSWLHATGQLEAHAAEVPDLARARRAPSFPVSGAAGGQSLGLDRLAALGVEVTGRLRGFAGRHAVLAGDLPATVADADRRMRRVLGDIDAYIERTGTRAAPPEPLQPFEPPPAPVLLPLDGFGTVLWATGYGRAYPWLDVPVLDGDGELIHHEGVTAVPGLFALGLRFQRRRNSHFVGGVGRDAARLAAIIALTAPAPRSGPGARTPGSGGRAVRRPHGRRPRAPR